MQTVQEIFSTIQQAQKRQRELRALYRDALKNAPSYTALGEEIASLKEKKRMLEEKIKGEFSKEFDMLDDISKNLKDEHARMADMVLSGIMKGEIIKVHDARNMVYDPIIKITFKKSDDQER